MHALLSSWFVPLYVYLCIRPDCTVLYSRRRRTVTNFFFTIYSFFTFVFETKVTGEISSASFRSRARAIGRGKGNFAFVGGSDRFFSLSSNHRHHCNVLFADMFIPFGWTILCKHFTLPAFGITSRTIICPDDLHDFILLWSTNSTP